MQTHDEALTEQDLAWLRRHTNFHGAETVLGAMFFMLFLVITVLFARIWLGGGLDHGARRSSTACAAGWTRS